MAYRRISAVLLLATIAGMCAAGYGLAAGGHARHTSLQQGRTLYRKYCGQCHALSAALAAGFGTENGLGTNGGPSFNNLRVPYKLSILAVTLPFIGHEVLSHKMTWTQIDTVSKYVSNITAHHPVVAQFTDG